jgi:hypothetical protein
MAAAAKRNRRNEGRTQPKDHGLRDARRRQTMRKATEGTIPFIFLHGCLFTVMWLTDKMSGMANLTLVYGMRLLPADEVTEVGDAPVKLQNGHEARVTMHILEGSREEIEAQLRHSIDAFFDFYPEI